MLRLNYHTPDLAPTVAQPAARAVSAHPLSFTELARACLALFSLISRYAV